MAKQKFVAVNTFRDNESPHGLGVGAVFGPFNTKAEAQGWIDAQGFPYPEQVQVRPVTPPKTLL